MVHYGRGGFEGVALVPVSGQKSKSDVWIGKRLSLQYSTDANRRRIRLQFHQIQTKAVRLIALHWSIDDVTSRGIQLAHAFIANIANERRIVEQFENE